MWILPSSKIGAYNHLTTKLNPGLLFFVPPKNVVNCNNITPKYVVNRITPTKDLCITKFFIKKDFQCNGRNEMGISNKDVSPNYKVIKSFSVITEIFFFFVSIKNEKSGTLDDLS